MEKEQITVEFRGHNLIGDIIPKSSQPDMLFLHGAGMSNRNIFDTFRELLAERGIASCAFDFIGYGETIGLVEESNLEDRTNQAQKIIEVSNIKKPLIIVAGSMAGYSAIKLTEIFPVQTLILSAPAVYDKDAYKVNFGNAFSEIIRKPESWRNTDAWDILKEYKGNLLILSAGKDTIIPPEIIDMIYQSSVNASSREIMHIINAPHKLASYLQENPDKLELVVDKVVSLLK